MGSNAIYEQRNLSPLISAYKAKLIAKGCGERKAEMLAWKKAYYR